MSIEFKGRHYPKDMILYAVFFYVRYAVSYRDLEEIMAERGVQIDQTTAGSWRMGETYIKVKGKWMYLYRAVDNHRKMLDFMLSRRRDKTAANLTGLMRINVGLKFSQSYRRIEILRVKYLNNIVEQVIGPSFYQENHMPTLGCKAFHSATASLAGIEVAHMIWKQQIQSNHTSPFKQFDSLAT